MPRSSPGRAGALLTLVLAGMSMLGPFSIDTPFPAFAQMRGDFGVGAEQMQLVVVKRSGVVEPFSREKVVTGVRKACKGRPVTEADLAKLGQRVEEKLRASGQAEIPADEVGVAILGPLRDLDPIAYLRFASVYKHYESVEDFEAEIARLRAAAEQAGSEPAASVPEPTAEQLF